MTETCPNRKHPQGKFHPRQKTVGWNPFEAFRQLVHLTRWGCRCPIVEQPDAGPAVWWAVIWDSETEGPIDALGPDVKWAAWANVQMWDHMCLGWRYANRGLAYCPDGRPKTRTYNQTTRTYEYQA